MSDVPFPSLPGLKMRVSRTSLHKTIVQSTQDGQELRVRRWAGPRYRYHVEFEFLRKTGGAVDEVTTLVNHINGHGGAFDSFPFTDPVDGVVRRVRYDSDEIEFERVVNGVWAVGELELVTTSVDYGASGGDTGGTPPGGGGNDKPGDPNVGTTIVVAGMAGATWLLSVDNAGVLATSIVTSSAPSPLILAAPDTTRYAITIDASGALVTTVEGGAAPTTTLSLTSPDGSTWSITVANDGALTTTEVP